MTVSGYIEASSIDFRDAWPPVGTFAPVTHDASGTLIAGSVDAAAEGDLLLVVDACGRLVATEDRHAGDFEIGLSARRAELISWPVRVYLYDHRTNLAHPLTSTDATQSETRARNGVPSFRERYVGVVIEALKERYTSVSSKDNILTGNGYQSVGLSQVETSGGRPHRDLFLRHVDFAGKSVLDVGANTGELSRLARRRGAALVDGYEYDPFFVETGRVINAVTGATRVSLFQGDATDPALYNGMKYDIILAFSVWVYIDNVLAELSRVADVLVLETHTLDHGTEMYTAPLSRYYPHHRLLGYEERPDPRKSRAVFVFAKSAESLAASLAVVHVRTAPYFDNAYFKQHSPTTSARFSDYAEEIRSRLKDEPVSGIGKSYFEAYVGGYAEYRSKGQVDAANPFLVRYRDAIERGSIDKNLRHLLENDARLFDRVQAKFLDLDNALADRWNLIAPITIRPAPGPLSFVTGEGRRIRAADIDGHHRFFIAQLLGRQTIDALVREPLLVGRSVLKTDYRIERAV